MSKLNRDIEDFHKHIHEYYPYGEVKSTQESRNFKREKHYIELIKDREDNLYVKKNIPYSEEREENFFFKREVECLVAAQNEGFPFVTLVEFEYPTIENPGYIITKYMEGGSVMKQINIQNGDNPNIESTSSDILFDDNLLHLATSHDDFRFDDVVLSNDRKMIIIYGTAEAISFLHARNITHRDIKPENILLHNSEPYLADFGFAKEVFKKEKVSKVCGSAPYIAPEIIRNEPADISADIYSFGVTMIMILSGKLTITMDGQTLNFYEIGDYKQIEIAMQGVKYNIDDNVPPNLKQFIYKCCDEKAENRPKIDEILNFLGSNEIVSQYGPEYKSYISKFNKK